ncbi:MAG: protein phosphatase CheZ [Steroidobacteraceae bacterium]
MNAASRALASFVPWVDALRDALDRKDESAFLRALSGINSVQESDVVTGVRRVADHLHSALVQFRLDSRLEDLAGRQVPDARQRLAHVLKLTDDAAHRTMDLVEQCGPLTDLIMREAQQLLEGQAALLQQRPELRGFLAETRERMQKARGMLGEVLLAQGYQDISGQIIRGVMKLVDELEQALGQLVFITGGELQPAAANEAGNELAGPVVPGVARAPSVAGQNDVDDLLSNLGM